VTETILDVLAASLEEAYGDTDYVELRRPEALKLARATLETLRDYCTQGMRMAGHAAIDASEASEEAVGARIGYAALGEAWRAMIDDALSRCP
jgi:hypothetical protein